MEQTLAERAVAQWTDAERTENAEQEARDQAEKQKAADQATHFLRMTFPNENVPDDLIWVVRKTYSDYEKIVATTTWEGVRLQYAAQEDQYTYNWTQSLRVLQDYCLHPECGQRDVIKFTSVDNLVTLGRAITERRTFHHLVPGRGEAYRCDGEAIRRFDMSSAPLQLTDGERKVIEGLRDMMPSLQEI